MTETFSICISHSNYQEINLRINFYYLISIINIKTCNKNHKDAFKIVYWIPSFTTIQAYVISFLCQNLVLLLKGDKNPPPVPNLTFLLEPLASNSQ